MNTEVVSSFFISQKCGLIFKSGILYIKLRFYDKFHDLTCSMET